MSLVLNIEKSSTSSDCATLTIVDNTGNYNVSTNPTGYGSPNESRVNLRLGVFVNLMKSTGREPVSVPAYNEATATTWTVTLTEDGWYEIYGFACFEYSSGTTYDIGHITYDPSTDLFYKSLVAGNIGNALSDTDSWEATTDVEDFSAAIADGQSDVYECTDNTVELCRSRKCEAQAILKAECCECDDCQMKDYEKIRLKIEAAAIAGELENYTRAQKIIENIQVLCENIDADCGC